MTHDEPSVVRTSVHLKFDDDDDHDCMQASKAWYMHVRETISLVLVNSKYTKRMARLEGQTLFCF